MNVLDEFLVALGFQVDETSLKKFTTAVSNVEKVVLRLGTAVTGAAAAVVAGVTVVSHQMEDLYYASQRTKATVGNLMGLRYAAGQIGVGAGQAQAALESFTRTLRLNPGTGGLLKQLGVSGNDPTQVFESFIAKMRGMKPYIAAQYAALFGIDPDTLLMLENGLDKLTKEHQKYQQRLAAFHINPEQAAKVGVDWDNSIRSVKEDFTLLWTVIESRLLPVLTPLIDQFEQWAETHAGDVAQGIADAVQNLADWIKSVDWKKVGDDFDHVYDALGGLKGILIGLAAIQLMPLVTGVLNLATAVTALGTASKGAAIGQLLKILGPIALLFHSENLNQGEDEYLKQRQAAAKGIDPSKFDFNGPANRSGDIPDDGSSGQASTPTQDTSDQPSFPDRMRQAADQMRQGIGNLANTAFGALIAKGEGDYNSINLGARGGYKASIADLSNMTIDQVMAAQRSGKFNAAGRYQLIGRTLSDAVKSLGLSGKQMFDKDTQDQIFSEYLVNNKRKAIGDYLSGRSNNLRSAMKAASLEWASVADPDTGKSHYAGVGNNRATISWQQMAEALQQTRALGAQGTNLANANMFGGAPLGGNQSLAGTNLTIQSQTDIHVGAGPTARETAIAVSNEQRRVNGDLVRNFAGAVT